MIFNNLYYFYKDTIKKLLIDFIYEKNIGKTYTITGWKGTFNKEPSTELIIPDSSFIVL